jgi:hypothetical protein
LRHLFQEHGSLAKLQEETHIGLACGGCRALLDYHFGEAPVEIMDFSHDRNRGATVCVKPGDRVMKCFIASSSLLESRAFSCNAVPPQLGNCDTTMTVEYTIYNQLGRPLLTRSQPVATGETFTFDTEVERLPRPFYGMIAYRLNRRNYGASRLNIAWHSGDSTTSTHENAATGRTDVVLPVPVDTKFLEGPNDIYLAIQNPHELARPITLRLFKLDEGNIYNAPPGSAEGGKGRHAAVVEFHRTLPPRGTMWIAANEELYAPALEKLGGGPVALRIYSPGATIHEAPSTYFFFHHRTENIWSANHM